MSSAILPQRFMTGLSLPICHQLLLNGQPATLSDAIKSANDAECALTFHPKQENSEDVHVIQRKSLPRQKVQGLEAALEGVTKHL